MRKNIQNAMVLVFLIMLFSCLSPTYPRFAPKINIEKEFENIETLLKKNKQEEAQALFSQIINDHFRPLKKPGLTDMGRIFASIGLNLDNFPYYLYLLIEYYLSYDMQGNALGVLKKIINDYPAGKFPQEIVASGLLIAPTAQIKIGDYLRNINPLESIKEYEKAIENFPGLKYLGWGEERYPCLIEPYMLLRIGFIYENQLQDYEKAVKTYEKIVKKYLNYVEKMDLKLEDYPAATAQLRIVRVLRNKLSDRQGAIKAAEKVLNMDDHQFIDPTRDHYSNGMSRAEALYTIAGIYQEAGDNEKAISCFRSVIEKYSSQGIGFWGGEIDNTYGEMAVDRIIEICSKVFGVQRTLTESREIEKAPDDWVAAYAQYMVGVVYETELQDKERAIKEYEKVLENHPLAADGERPGPVDRAKERIAEILKFSNRWLSLSLLSAYEDQNIDYNRGPVLRGRVLYVRNYIAYLAIDLFDVKYFKLIAVDFKEKKVLWEVKTKGWITNCFPVTNNRLVTIENDCLVSRNILNGQVYWDIDLRTISPKQKGQKEYPFRRKNPLPADSNFFCLTFLANSSCGIVFRQDYSAYHDLINVGDKDWLRIDLDTGKCMDSGLHELIECGIDYALVRDDENYFLLNQKGLTKLGIQNKKQFLDQITLDDSYDLQSQSQQFARPIRVLDLDDSNKLLIFNPQKKLLKMVAIRNHAGYQCRSGWAGQHVVCFSECIRSDADKIKQKKPFWIETYDLDGNRIGRREENIDYWLSYEGQFQNGDILFELNETGNQHCAWIRRFSMPELSLISEYKLENIEGFQSSVITEVEGTAVLSFLDKKLFDEKPPFRFRFINLNTKQEYWTFAPDVSVKSIKEN